MTHLSRPLVLTSLLTFCSLTVACVPAGGDDNGSEDQTGVGGNTGAGANPGGRGGAPFAGGAGNSSATGGAPGAGMSACPSDALCSTGVPFVIAALANSDVSFPGAPSPTPGTTTATLTNPEPGKLCLTGRVEDGFAAIVLAFLPKNVGILEHGLDVQARGIKSLRMTLETPPATGLGIEIASAVPGCQLGAADCIHYGFYYSVTPTAFAAARLGEGTTLAPLENFLRAEWIDTSWVLDLSNVGTVSVGTGLPWAATGDYAFCMKDFAFLDAAGNPVQPE